MDTDNTQTDGLHSNTHTDTHTNTTQKVAQQRQSLVYQKYTRSSVLSRPTEMSPEEVGI